MKEVKEPKPGTLEWQRKVIREEYVENKEPVKKGTK
jgi:hypothetical protein